MKLCYVTAYLDINRSSWTRFNRTFNEYFEAFTPLVDLFNQYKDPNYQLIVYIDKKHIEQVKQYIGSSPNIQTIEIDYDWLSHNSVLWKRLPRDQEIVRSDQFQRLIPHRLQYPEHNNAEYSMLNHAKIDMIHNAMTLTDADYLCWIDFGYFKNRQLIPQQMLDIQRFDPRTIHYTLISPLESNDSDIYYTLCHAPERIGGYFFLGHRTVLEKYRQLYHNVHSHFQQLGIVDDDQHLALQCYYTEPSLFTLHVLYGWHKALIHFQRFVST